MEDNERGQEVEQADDMYYWCACVAGKPLPLLFSSLLPISATSLFRVSAFPPLPPSASLTTQTSPPSLPFSFPPLKIPVRVFQFPIHSARNPSRRLRHSISLPCTHTRTRSKSFLVSVEDGNSIAYSHRAIKSLCALSVCEESAHLSIMIFCVSFFLVRNI